MSKYLLEIGVEEFPVSYIENTKNQLRKAFEKLFKEEGIIFEEIRLDATPRRFVIRIKGLSDSGASTTEEQRGPSARIAYDEEGNPSKALEGFLRGQKAELKDVNIKKYKDEDYVFVVKRKEGKNTKILIRDNIPSIIKSLSFPRSMHWGNHDFRFARPIRWFVSLYDNEILDFDMKGIPVGSVTRGHRVLGSQNIEIENIDEFEEKLLENYVVLDSDKRREMISLNAERLAREIGGSLEEDNKLLDEIIYLVEYPTALLGEIPQEYMALPDSVILTPMRDHQRFFPVFDDNHKPMAYFVSIRNGDDNFLDNVRAGNEKVLTPRLEDAKFFFEEDMKKPLYDYVEDLKGLVFHDKLGSVYDKTERVRALAKDIGEILSVGESTLESIDRVAYLAKADLVTNLVNEFTELQGVIGGVYARESGEAEIVSKAIGEHYLPISAGGKQPETRTGTVVSLADKIDSICGFFAANEKITGSQDPFGLRRTAIAILDILLENKLDISLDRLVTASLYHYVDSRVLIFPYEETKENIMNFIFERLRNRFTSQGLSYDVVDSVLKSKPGFVYDAYQRILALESFLKNNDRDNLLQALTRVVRITKDIDLTHIEEDLFENDFERSLYSLDGKYDEILKLIEKSKYEEALIKFNSASYIIDNYFDNIMVMVDDEKLKNNRLALLNSINLLILMIFDPSEIVGKE